MLKILTMFQLPSWYNIENVEEIFVETVARRCSNFGKETGLYMNNINNNYKVISTKCVLNTILDHFGMSWIIEKSINGV